MLSRYSQRLDIPIWLIVLPGGTYALRPTATRPGGPVVFTSERAAERFLAYHEDRWSALVSATVVRAPVSLEGFLRQWRFAFGVHGVEPVALGTCYVNPRRPIAGLGDVDAETIPFTADATAA